MLSPEEALAKIDEATQPLGTEKIPLTEAVGRVLSEDITSASDLPRFTQSAMDGYAINSSDTINASEQNPIMLDISGEVHAGSFAELPKLEKNTAYRIFTGAPMPTGADAVILQEEAKIQDNKLVVTKKVPQWENVRRAGEEIKKGTLLVKNGTRLTVETITTIALTGCERILVNKQPQIAIITTGNEVVELGKNLQLGQTFNTNYIFISTFLKSKQYKISFYSHIPDLIIHHIGTFQKAIQKAHLIITTGGASVGAKDLIKATAKQWDFKEIFWKVSQKPGKPLYFAKRTSTYLLGLPGNPAATFVCFYIYALHLLDRLEGIKDPQPKFLHGILNNPITPDTHKTKWIRANIEYTNDGKIKLIPLPHQASHEISNLAQTRAIIKIPPAQNTLQEGTILPFLLIN
jgi:molybdopterin molybdotransferase